MTIIDAVSWWYGWGWLHVLEVLKRRLVRLYNVFSVRQMLRTLFAPWKEDRVSGARGLDQMLRALVMNFVARLVGFSVRLMIVAFWALLSVVMILAGVTLFVAWPLLPALIAGLFVYGAVL
ncbi:MAG: hypothetical protein U0526_00930 [Candidatus Saccharibacteria bacterium]|jgi:hypothetical protein